MEAFAVYLADDASGSNEVFVASTSSSHSQLTVPAGTLAGGRSFVLVYCENALGRATSAASVTFSDWALSMPSTTRTLTSATTTSSTVTFTLTDGLRTVGTPSFTDHDPAVYQLNGTVSWIPPADCSGIEVMPHWLLTRQDYSTSVFEVLSTGVQVDDPTTPDGNVPLGTNQLAFAQSRDLGSNGYAQFLAVIPNRVDNDLAASYSQAGFVSIVDLPLTSLGALEVQSISFSDEDSVATYVKGTVTWTRQENLDYGFVEAFAVYLADDASGSNEVFRACLLRERARPCHFGRQRRFLRLGSQHAVHDKNDLNFNNNFQPFHF
eukprot:s4498_g8.t1